MDGFGHDVPADDVHEALQRILGSSDFEASERNRRFLQYVEETLAGRPRASRPTASPRTSSGVTAASIPRQIPSCASRPAASGGRFERHYLTAGSDDLVRITIPKGSYVPAFQAAAGIDGDRRAEGDEPRTESPAPAAAAPLAASSRLSRRLRAPTAVAAIVAVAAVALGITFLTGIRGLESPPETAAERGGPATFVATFNQEGDLETFPDFAKGFTREVIVGLTRFNDLFVFGPETTFRHGGELDLGQIAADLGVDLVLTGGTTVSPDGFGVHALLIDATTGRYVWAERFADTLGTASILAARDARSLAQPYGVIFANQVENRAGGPHRRR